MRQLFCVALVAVVAAACSPDPSSETEGSPVAGGAPPTSDVSATPAVVEGPTVTVVVDDEEVEAELAATSAQRQRGLMFRESLGEDAGMLFLFRGPRQGGFWMKNTLIPLSIAYMQEAPATGGGVAWRIAAIIDMEPCEADPCPVYDPGVAYSAALEVAQGWFGEHGIEVGATVHVDEPLPTPDP